MIELPMEVTPEGGEAIRVVATSRDIRAWEKVCKEFQFSNTASLAMRDIYGIAWKAAVRQKVFTGTITDFEAQFDLDVLGDEVEEDENPTPAAP